jgi:hypothetical protein
LGGKLTGHYFVSYSRIDAAKEAPWLADTLAEGPTRFPLWVDKRELRPGEDWDEQIVEAIKTCRGLLFVMTTDSVRPNSMCKREWTRALKYKKPVIPLRSIARPSCHFGWSRGSMWISPGRLRRPWTACVSIWAGWIPLQVLFRP